VIASNYRPKTLIVISNSFHLRSVVESGLLTRMDESVEIILALENSLSSNLPIFQARTLYFSTSRVNLFFSNLIMDSGTWKFRNLSSSFRYRIQRKLRGDVLFYKLKKTSKIKFPFRYTRNLLRYILLGNLLSNYMLKLIYELLQKREDEVTKILGDTNPDVVLIWSQTLDPVSSAFIYNSQKLSIPNLLVTDNWDNLFSKTVFPISPDYVGCFGVQSADFGSKLHGIPRERFFEIGSARFEVYRGLPQETPRSLILFAGSSMPEDDENILRIIDAVRVEKADEGNPEELYWRYRRHPAPQHTISNFESLFPNVEFTNRIKDARKIEWPSLQDSVTELTNTRVAICMPTSYLLEALVCEVPVIIPVFTNMYGLTSARALMESLAHLKNVDKLPGVHIATSPSEFKDHLAKLIAEDCRVKTTAELDYFIKWSGNSFSENLTATIFEITGPQQQSARTQQS